MISRTSSARFVPANLLPCALVLLPAALVGWVGVSAFGISPLLLVVLLLGRRRQLRPSWLAALSASVALLGGVVGVSSAGSAIATVGGLPPYETRLAFGWAALALAAAATVCGVAGARPVAPSVAMVLAGLLGAAAIGLFYINTF